MTINKFVINSYCFNINLLHIVFYLFDLFHSISRFAVTLLAILFLTQNSCETNSKPALPKRLNRLSDTQPFRRATFFSIVTQLLDILVCCKTCFDISLSHYFLLVGSSEQVKSTKTTRIQVTQKIHQMNRWPRRSARTRCSAVPRTSGLLGNSSSCIQ